MTVPPPITSGTFTFLFSDIEGSTRLEQRVGTARYGELRERHRAILRGVFAANDGIEQGTEGDSFFVVFASARAAVAAAVAAQRQLAAESWPEGEAVRVRIGLHSGEAELAGDSLVGLDINRAARIASVGHGGQILLSEATRALVQGHLPADVRLRDLGAYRLKDLLGPEHVVQVEADDLPADFPPLRTPDARPNNLPTQLTTFVGPRSRARGGRPTPVDDPPADPDRPRRNRQDAAVAPAGLDRRRRVPRRRLLRAAGTDPRRDARGVADRHGRRGRGERRATDRRHAVGLAAGADACCSSSTTSSRSRPRPRWSPTCCGRRQDSRSS